MYKTYKNIPQVETYADRTEGGLHNSGGGDWTQAWGNIMTLVKMRVKPKGVNNGLT